MNDACPAPLGDDLLLTATLLQQSSEVSTSLDLVRYTLSIINQILILIVTIGLSWTCYKMEFQKTAMHAFLCTLGFVFLSAEGMMVRYSGNPLTNSLEPETKTNLHFALQLLGGILGIWGTIHKSIAKERHVHTVHGKLGTIACIFFAINCGTGLWGLWFPNYRTQYAGFINFLHMGLGLITFLVAMLAQYYGYWTGFYMRNFKDNLNLYRHLTVLIFILTIVGPFRIFVKKCVDMF